MDSPFTFVMSLAGGSFRFRRVLNDSPPGDAPCKGSIRGFSRQSRLRLLRFLNAIDFSEIPSTLFITLTFPDSVDPSRYRFRTYARNLFWKKTERFLGRKVAMLWRQEWVPRQSGKHQGQLYPHFHLMVYDVRRIPYDIVRGNWGDAIGYDGVNLATDVQRVKGEEACCKYIGKYLAKNPSLDIRPYVDRKIEMGRFWGVSRKSLITMQDERLFEITSVEQLNRLLELARRTLNKNSEWISTGFTVLGKQGRKIFDEISNMR